MRTGIEEGEIVNEEGDNRPPRPFNIFLLGKIQINWVTESAQQCEHCFISLLLCGELRFLMSWLPCGGLPPENDDAGHGTEQHRKIRWGFLWCLIVFVFADSGSSGGASRI